MQTPHAKQIAARRRTFRSIRSPRKRVADQLHTLNVLGEELMAIANKIWSGLNIIFWACVAVVTYLYCSGFCFSELRYLSDKDFIVRAIQHNTYRIGIRNTPDEIEAFLRANPDCCTVNLNGMLSGFRSVEVELNFMDRFKSSVGNPPYYRQYVEITSCGGRGEMAGEHTETLKRAGEV